MIKQQFLKFIIIGIFSTVVNYTMFYILYACLAIYYMLASGVGFFAGVFAGYALNKKWTFGIKEKTTPYILKYVITYTVSLFLGLGFLKFLVEFLAIIPQTAHILMIGLTTCINFTGIKYWVFKK